MVQLTRFKCLRKTPLSSYIITQRCSHTETPHFLPAPTSGWARQSWPSSQLLLHAASDPHVICCQCFGCFPPGHCPASKSTFPPPSKSWESNLKQPLSALTAGSMTLSWQQSMQCFPSSSQILLYVCICCNNKKLRHLPHHYSRCYSSHRKKPFPLWFCCSLNICSLLILTAAQIDFCNKSQSTWAIY